MHSPNIMALDPETWASVRTNKGLANLLCDIADGTFPLARPDEVAVLLEAAKRLRA